VLRSVVQTKSRRDALDQASAELAAQPSFVEVAGSVVCAASPR
jgi:hypothetical protein